ncbi:MAG TPA: glutathione S-transferase N-terminal domain-containing protein [Ottowia sp.]|uniref:glutathione S-transferase family protein n=1 Tax=Ottowia sp. TaxID=1898956 RepID=UPI002B764E57|nr:glutathione S-transferase N-terminal domain-containing protein [Ottowia sp.]HMN21662.1 glutathione S-transferase N-terminal domain-containing protein [Ottowia sp.]
MTLKLYYAPGACSFVPHSMLEQVGATFEPVAIKLHKDEQHSAEYLAVNPRAQVPVLVDEGTVITQIVAIVLHIDALFPEAGLIPRERLARTRFIETLAWMNNTVHPTFTHVFMPFKFSDDEAARQAIKAHALGQYRQLLDELQGLLRRARAEGHDWLGGAHCGALDTYALTLLRWGTIAGIDPEDTPELWAHVQRTAQVPAVGRAMARERLQLSLYRPAT